MPPRRFNYEEETNLRHLPDPSDASFSFQIPNNTLLGNDCLLDEDEMSFLRDTNDDDENSVMPGSDGSNFGPLILEELAHPFPEANTASHHRHSPKPSPACSGSKAPLRPTLQAPEQAQVTRSALPTDQMRPNLKLTTQNTPTSAEIKSSAISRFEVLRAEFELLDNETSSSPDPRPPTNISESSHENRPTAPSSSRQERPAMKTERLRTKAAISGRIVQTRSRTAALSGIVHDVVSVPAVQDEVLLPPEPQSRVVSDNADFLLHSSNLDLSICSTTPGGVGENLVMYNQTSTRAVTQHASSPGEPGKGDPELLLLTERRNSIAENVHQGDGRNSPLTLSQISPRKAADSHRNPPAMDPGGGWSMRQSTKRPASEASSSQPATKKGRSHANASDEASAIITRGLRSAGSRAPAKNSTSSSGSRRVRRRVQETRDSDGEGTLVGQKKPTVRKSVLEKSSGEDVTGNLSRSDSRCSSSGVSNPRLSRSNNLATSGTWVQGDGEAGTLKSMGMPACHERTQLPPANKTKPVGFKLQIDARIEGRKAEFEKEKLLALEKQSMRKHHQVPDFKTIHAAEEARAAGLRSKRKRDMVPTVPQPFELSTDGRAREREKFEEQLRQKERESQRVLEEKRREEQEIEERAIKELRKKAVPRAHEVPEWYKDVPKRKIRDLDTNRD